MENNKMKSKMIFALALAAAAMSCTKEKIATYNESTKDRYIYFKLEETDSSDVSFYSYPGQTSIDYPVVVKSTGYSTKAQTYSVRAIPEYTTADASDFSLPETFTFRPESAVDTFYVRLNYSSKLDHEKFRIVLELEDTDDFKLGMTESRVAIIWFHNNIVRPDWWTSAVSSYYMGNYSEAKYKLFLEVVKVDLDGADNSLIRHYALVFKRYLEERKAAGNPALEDDGTEMKVLV